MDEQMNDGVFALVTAANKAVKELEIPSIEAIDASLRGVMRMVAHDLENKNLMGAMDKVHKTQAMEQYFKKLVKTQPSLIIHQNTVTAYRIRELREIGEWIDKYMAPKGINKDANTDGEFYIWYEDLEEAGIVRTNVENYRHLARWDNNIFEEYLYEHTHANGYAPEELTWSKTLGIFYPINRNDYKPREIPEILTEKEEIKLYLWAQDGERIIKDYVKMLNEGRGKLSGTVFIREMVGSLWRNLASFWKKMVSATEVKDAGD